MIDLSPALPVAPTSPDFARLAPTGPDYATRPIDEAVDWSAVVRPSDAGEWYLVVFRSTRRPTAPEERLTWVDDRAHADAATRPGFVHYFKGPLTDARECLSFCLWSGRAEARQAARRPDHRAAVLLIEEAYDRYALEFYRVRKARGE